MFFSSTKRESMKQCVEPESTKALKIMVFGKSEVVTILCCMSYSTAEETQIIGKSTRSLGRGKFSILTKFLPQICFLPFRVLGGRSVITRIGFFVFVLIVVVAVVVIIVIRRAGGLVLWFVVLPV